MNPSEIRPFRLSILLVNSALVLPPAFLYSLKTDSPVYFLIASALLLFAFFRKDFLPLRDRPVIYSVTAALILTVFPDMLIVIDDSRYGIFDLLIRSNLVIPLMTYLAALSCAFYPYYVRRGLTAAGVISALVLCGDRFNYSRLSNDLLFFLDPLLRHYPLVYGIAAGWTVVAILLNLLYPGRVEHPAGGTRLRGFWLCVCLILLPLGAAGVQKYYYSNDRLMRAIEYYILRFSMRKYMAPRRNGPRLSGQTDLNMPLPRERFQNTVLMRVKSPVPPGYLRSGNYDFYHYGRWRLRRGGESVKLNAERRTGLVSYSTFTLPGKTDKKDGMTMELYFAGLAVRDRIPVPGNMLELDAVADSGEVSKDGIFTLKQLKADGGCTVRTENRTADPAWQGPADAGTNAMYLAVPKELRPELSNLLKPGAAPSQTLSELQKFFKSFSYTLEGVNTGKKQDPVLYFLKVSRAGHCEFFATAAVLLLRNAGIPARYVTGFLCQEKSSAGDYYVVRTMHAHAWCEAYLKDRGEWVIADFTPSGVLESFRQERSGSPFRAWLDAVKHFFQQIFADIRRGHFAQAMMNLLTGIWGLVWRLVRTVPGMILLLLAAGMILVWFYRTRRGKNSGTDMLPESRRDLAAVFLRFERQYAAVTRKRRPEAAALLDFYGDSFAAELCREYERLRYGKTEPTRQEIRDFSAASAEVLTLIRKAASPHRRD